MRGAFAALLLASSTAFAGAPPARVAAPAMPRLVSRVRTLVNGLRVVSARDTTSPTVAVHVWYHVGSKDDPEGRSGFAHLFEHMLFKGTKNTKPETMDRLTEDVGGFNNATTRDDATIYYEVVPSNYLETLLWAEADRLASLTVDDTNFKSERDVVKEEFRQSVLAPPYGRLFYAIDKRSFTTHPYRRPGIGSIEELDAASLEDVRAFHRTFYRPDNATLIVTGDFDEKQLDAWVDRYFTGIGKPAAPMPRVQVKEPARTAERRFTERGPNVPLPAVAMTYLTVPKTSPDAEALRVADALLSAGESSRLFRALVYEQQVASRVASGADQREDAGLFMVFAVAATGKKPEEVEKALLAEVEKLKAAPVSAAELAKVKNQLLADALRERETNNGKAFALGEAVVFHGDAERANTDLAKLQAVTAADVARVMKTYFGESNRTVLTYLADEPKPASEGGK